MEQTSSIGEQFLRVLRKVTQRDLHLQFLRQQKLAKIKRQYEILQAKWDVENDRIVGAHDRGELPPGRYTVEIERSENRFPSYRTAVVELLGEEVANEIRDQTPVTTHRKAIVVSRHHEDPLRDGH